MARTAATGLRNVVSAVPHGLNKAGGIRGALSNPKAFSKAFADRFTGRDPIDLVTGEMVMQATDFELPALLPLVLQRTYSSAYGAGRWFGPSWSSFLDQRLEVDERGVCFAYTEAVLLSYPAIAPGESALPDEGPRLRLERRADGHYLVREPQTGRTFWFAPPGDSGAAVLPLAAVSDRNGNRIDIGYDPETGWLAELAHTGGYRVEIDCEAGRITAFRLPALENATLVRYRYDDQGRLTDVYNSSGLPLKFGYDQGHRITSWTDRNGTWYRYTYDAKGRVVRTAGSAHCLDGEIRYDPDNQVTVEINSLGAATAYHYNENGQVERVLDPLGQATGYTWDRYHRKTSETDPLGRTTQYRHDENDDLTVITRPDGAQTVFTYDADHRPLAMLQPDGLSWRRQYDSSGNLVAAADPSGAVRRFTYDSRGAMLSNTDAVGRVTTFETDAAGLLISAIDPAGSTTTIERDAGGRPVTVADALGRATAFTWTIEGRLASRTSADGHREQWLYDAEGNFAEYTGADGQRTRIEYTSFDLPSLRTDALGAQVAFTYDTELRLTSVTDAQGLTWTYEYDPAGRLVRERDYDGRVLSYRYDAAGQLTERVNGAGQVTGFGYDELGNLASRSSDDVTTVFEFDRLNRLMRAADPFTAVEYTRDANGRVTSESIDGWAVGYTYDAAGQLLRRRSPSGAVSTWEYDQAGRVSLLTSAGRTQRFAHDALGREVSRLVPGAQVDQAWDAEGRLFGQRIVGGQRVVQERRYGWTSSNGLSRIDDFLRGRTSFDLDALQRICGVGGSRAFAYSADGALVSTPEAGGPWEREGSRVRRAGPWRYEYDRQGRVISRQQRLLSGGTRVWRYRWDALDRLVAVSVPDGDVWRYRYDALGRRVGKEQFRGETLLQAVRYSWDGFLLGEQDQTDGRVRTTRTWDWEPGTMRPLSQLERSGPHGPIDEQAWYDARFRSIVTDLSGAPAELLDEDGVISWRREAGVWGARPEGIAADCPLQFPGQEHDEETGLDYNVHRYYDPQIGAYLSADPLGLAAAPNARAYVPNPYLWADPLGLQSCYSDVLSSESRQHILGGDAGGGSHRWPAAPGKTSYPLSWSDDQIMHNVGDIVTSPSTVWHVEKGNGGVLTSKGKPAVWRAWEVRDGVRLRIAYEPYTGKVRTAFPDNGPATGPLVP
nr:DUF6531 domain-containing protein [Kineosporia babensis]